jgi:hypothetical protein
MSTEVDLDAPMTLRMFHEQMALRAKVTMGAVRKAMEISNERMPQTNR